jgi:predicted nucleotidyltransferase
MADRTTHNTPYPDVNAVLDLLLVKVQATLAHNFVALYLHGSLACGDFELQTNDIDFVVVTGVVKPFNRCKVRLRERRRN